MAMEVAPHPNDTGLGMMAAMMSDQTCGEACWHAREEICRCSCGGLNHGCLKDKNGKAPARSARIDGFPYILLAVGSLKDVYGEASKINSVEAVGYKSIERVTADLVYHYTWKETDKGAPARVKYATKTQLLGWRELQGWKEIIEKHPHKEVCLLWKRVKSLQEAAKMESFVQIDHANQ